MNKSGLIFRLATVVIFTAIIVGVVTSQVFFRITYLSELSASTNKIEQLVKTVSSTASIATYLEDVDLVNEVISGLKTNDVVTHVAIKTNTLNAQSEGFVDSEQSLSFDLYSPFESERKVGSIILVPNIEHIRARSSKISWDNQIAITLQATIITLSIIFISYVVVTKPIISIAKRLSRLEPGTEHRVQKPRYHKKSEIGGLVRDINSLLIRNSEQIVEERKLRLQVEKLSKNFKLLFDNSRSPIVLTEVSGNVVLYNNAFVDLLEKLSIPLKQSFGPYLRDLFEDADALDSMVEKALSNNEFASGEFKLHQQNEEPSVWVQVTIDSSVNEEFREYYQITLHDISLRRQHVEQLNLKANTDELTQLFNRRGIEKEMALYIKSEKPFALLLLDLNKFKPINDIYGHDAGDEVLIHVSSQMASVLRSKDILSRWGGDEFVVVLPEYNVEEVNDICKTLQKSIEKPYFLAKNKASVSVSACIGVTFYPEENTTIESLVKSADEAMYSLKRPRHPEKRIAFYDSNKGKASSCH